MTLLILALTSVVSLFFSLIFATSLFQRKAWNPIYVSLSLLFLSITSISLFIGQLFSWYQWICITFIFSYTLITPIIFGLVWVKIVSLLKPHISHYANIAFALVLGLLSIGLLWGTWQLPLIEIVQDQRLTLGWLSTELPTHSWVIGISSILVIVGSLFLWLRKQGTSWLWLSLSGLLIYLLDRLLTQEAFNLLGSGIILFLIALFLYQGSKGLVSED